MNKERALDGLKKPDCKEGDKDCKKDCKAGDKDCGNGGNPNGGTGGNPNPNGGGGGNPNPNGGGGSDDKDDCKKNPSTPACIKKFLDDITKVSDVIGKLLGPLLDAIKKCLEAIKEEDKCKKATLSLKCYDVPGMVDPNAIEIVKGMKTKAEDAKFEICKDEGNKKNDGLADLIGKNLWVSPFDSLISDDTEDDINEKIKLDKEKKKKDMNTTIPSGKSSNSSLIK